jgi:hypothetical protein
MTNGINILLWNRMFPWHFGLQAGNILRSSVPFILQGQMEELRASEIVKRACHGE